MREREKEEGRGGRERKRNGACAHGGVLVLGSESNTHHFPQLDENGRWQMVAGEQLRNTV